MNIARRNFIFGAASAAAFSGCRSFRGAKPALRMGVISDIHITTPDSADVFERALRAFRDWGCDAVMVPGDLTDWGLKSGLRYVADAWWRVFPKDRAPDGRKVAKLFCTGNHDFDGFWYGDMTVEMHAHGYSEDEALVRLPGGVKGNWEEIFQEPYDDVRLREVNGFSFVSGEWVGREKAGAWFAANKGKLDPAKPFFYFQHPPVENTTMHSGGSDSRDGVRQALNGFSNAVAFSGHTHWTFHDERSIWQDAFTAVTIPSMSYSTVPDGYENGSGKRNGTCTLAMPKIPSRPDQTEAQGYFVSVFGDRMELERYDFTQMRTAAQPWIVPLPVSASKPYAPKAAAARAPVPQFPEGAKLRLRTRNTEDRQGKWVILQQFMFPAAKAEGGRAFDYEVRAVAEDGSETVVKRFLSPAFDKPLCCEPAEMLFGFNAAQLPQDKDYHFAVYPRNCFGSCGRPLLSGKRRGTPGLSRVKPEKK